MLCFVSGSFAGCGVRAADWLSVLMVEVDDGFAGELSLRQGGEELPGVCPGVFAGDAVVEAAAVYEAARSPVAGPLPSAAGATTVPTTSRPGVVPVGLMAIATRSPRLMVDALTATRALLADVAAHGYLDLAAVLRRVVDADPAERLGKLAAAHTR